MKDKRTADQAGMRPIRADHLSRMLNQTVHVSWACASARWKLLRIEQGKAHLVTPKTGRTLVVDVRDLRYTRNNAPCEVLIRITPWDGKYRVERDDDDRKILHTCSSAQEAVQWCEEGDHPYRVL